MISLGSVPEEITVTLSRGGDFFTTLSASEVWPEGVSIQLRLSTTVDPLDLANAVVWTATISGTEATWDISATEVDQVIEDKRKKARLHYIAADGSVLVWGRGETNVV